MNFGKKAIAAAVVATAAFGVTSNASAHAGGAIAAIALGGMVLGSAMATAPHYAPAPAYYGGGSAYYGGGSAYYAPAPVYYSAPAYYPVPVYYGGRSYYGGYRSHYRSGPRVGGHVRGTGTHVRGTNYR